jgi:hypothetical protein
MLVLPARGWKEKTYRVFAHCSLSKSVLVA